MSASEQTLALLTEIRDGIRQLVALQQGGGASSGAVASDRDLDSKYGDPEVRMRVRDWSGPDMKGKRYSQCPAEFLELLAEALEWVASKADAAGEKTDSGKPVSYYRRADAARARGWSARIRAGKVAQPQAEADDWGEDRNAGGGW